MPQLAPMNWLILFFCFSIVLLFTQVKVYYFLFNLKGKSLLNNITLSSFPQAI